MQITSYSASERGDAGIVAKLHVDGHSVSLLVTVDGVIRERGEYTNDHWVSFDLKILAQDLLNSPETAATLLHHKRMEWETILGFRD